MIKNKKYFYILSCLCVILVIASAILWFKQARPTENTEPNKSVSKESKDTEESSALTEEEVLDTESSTEWEDFGNDTTQAEEVTNEQKLPDTQKETTQSGTSMEEESNDTDDTEPEQDDSLDSGANTEQNWGTIQ